MALVVEVADSTLERDRTTKKRAYARAAIPTYWLINLIDRQVEVFTEPSGPSTEPDFRRSNVLRESDSVNLRIEDREIGPIAVRDLLPQASPSTPLLPK